jgi:hypothetical protein
MLFRFCRGKVIDYFWNMAEKKNITSEVKELVAVCEKQVRHYELIAKDLGLTKQIEVRFPYYKPMKEALSKIKND